MEDPAIVLLFPGQGAQHSRMAWGLYGVVPEFTVALDEAFAAFGPDGADLRTDWLSEHPKVPLDHPTRSQLLLYSIDYALGRLLLERGVRPWALLGHSIGEMAAATLAGVFRLADVAPLILRRMRLLADAPAGGMLAVAEAPEAVIGLLSDGVAVAAINAPRQTILAGPSAPLAATAEALRDRGITVRRVPSLTAFHSHMLAPFAQASAVDFARTPGRAPQLPLYSSYVPGPLTAEMAADADYWSSHPVSMVRFWPALDQLVANRANVLCVEAGPGQGLSTIARRCPSVIAGRSAVLPVLPPRLGTPDADRMALATALQILSGMVPGFRAVTTESA